MRPGDLVEVKFLENGVPSYITGFRLMETYYNSENKSFKYRFIHGKTRTVVDIDNTVILLIEVKEKQL